jgi:acetylglutamate kinase
MIPKLSCCTDALDQGVRKTHIINGKIKNALLLELFTESGIGTEIKF